MARLRPDDDTLNHHIAIEQTSCHTVYSITGYNNTLPRLVTATNRLTEDFALCGMENLHCLSGLHKQFH